MRLFTKQSQTASRERSGCNLQVEASMTKFLSRFMRDESGATAIEYCLIAAGIGIVIIVGIGQFATALNASLANSAATVNP